MNEEAKELLQSLEGESVFLAVDASLASIFDGGAYAFTSPSVVITFSGTSGPTSSNLLVPTQQFPCRESHVSEATKTSPRPARPLQSMSGRPSFPSSYCRRSDITDPLSLLAASWQPTGFGKSNFQYKLYCMA